MFNKTTTAYLTERISTLIVSALMLLMAQPLLAQEPEPEGETMQDTTTNMQAGSVSRAMFTSEILDREPVDDIDRFGASNGQVFFFTELTNMTGQTVTHRWEYNGEVIAEVRFDVGGPRWRVYSSKNILPEWVGEWTVVVLDDTDQILEARSLEVTADSITNLP